MPIDSTTLSSAIVIWTGYGHTSWPSRDEARVESAFGTNVATELVPVVRSLEEDFYRSEAHLTAVDLDSMAAEASRRFKQRHPEVSDEAIAALAWCYTFDYK